MWKDRKFNWMTTLGLMTYYLHLLGVGYLFDPTCIASYTQFHKTAIGGDSLPLKCFARQLGCIGG